MREHLIVYLVACFMISPPAHGQATRPLRVALYDFDQTNVTANIKKELGHDQNYGKTAADLLLSRLVNSNVEVISRDQIERLLKEQNFKYSDRFDATQAAQYGKLLGVDAIVSGTIDSLYIEITKKSIVIRQKQKAVATVEITAKLISTASGKVLAAPSYKGTFEKDIGTAYLGPIGGNKNQNQNQQQNQGGGAGGETGSRQGADPYIRDAIKDAIQNIAKDLVAAFPNLQMIDTKRPLPRPTSRPIETEQASNKSRPADTVEGYMALDDEIGAVMRVTDQSVLFSINDGVSVKPGDVLEIQRAEIIADPRTNKKIAVGEKTGTIQVVEVKSAYIRGNLTAGKAAANDRVVTAHKSTAPVTKKSTTPVKTAPGGKPIPPPPGR